MSQNHEKKGTKRLIASKPVFVSAILLFVLITLSIWLSGIGIHRSVFKNGIIAVTAISFICFLFFSIALFYGFKLKDNLGRMTSKFKWEKFSAIPDLGFGGGHSIGSGEGLLEILGIIVFSIIIFLLLLVFLWLFGNLVWGFIIFVVAALYWIFFRAVRFVLRHGGKCRGNLWKSVVYGFAYTVLYSFTFYFLLLIPHLLNR